jgi:hypothetical protein
MSVRTKVLELTSLPSSQVDDPIESNRTITFDMNANLTPGRTSNPNRQQDASVTNSNTYAKQSP